MKFNRCFSKVCTE